MARFLPFVLVLVVFGFALMRRMRPQPVRPQRLAVTAAIIVLLLGFTAFSAGLHMVKDVPALLLAPVALAVGCAVGALLVRHTRFWTRDGELWMAGGVVFAVILLLTIAVRVGLRVAAGAENHAAAVAPGGFLADVSTDLLFLSMGMWVTRAALVYLRWRRHVTAAPDAATS
jgi:membrane protein CcdC involved in cytochrome C biogenesis